MTGRYVVGRLAVATPTLLGLTFLVFLLGSFGPDPSAVIAGRNLPPGVDPTGAQIEAVHHALGLDRPLLARYGQWLGNAVHGNLGQSLVTGQGVGDAILKALPATATLAVVAAALVLVVSVPLGVVGALLSGRWFQQVVRVAALAGASIPGFFLAYLLIYLFAVRLHLLPVAGQIGLKSLVLPSVTLAVGPTALVSRILQTSLVEQLGEEYIRTARAKGVGETAIVVSHAVRNALLPMTTVFGGIVARLLEGAVVVELIFSRSGIGALTLTAVGSGDYPMIQGIVLLAGVVIIGFNLAVDLTYPLLDTRVRLGAGS